MSLDLMKLDEWSPLEIFPPVPYPHGLREVRTPHWPPLFQSIKRASGVQVPSNKRASTEQQACKYRATSVQVPCNIRVLLGWNPPLPGSNALKKVYFWGCFGGWGDGV